MSVHDSVDDLAAAERSASALSEYEDMGSQRKRYRYRNGTVDACRLPADKSMPKTSATGADLRVYQERMSATLKGGFDPCSMIR